MKIMAVTHPYADGQKWDEVEIIYDRPVIGAEIADFQVAGRILTGCETDGAVVRLKLSAADSEAFRIAFDRPEKEAGEIREKVGGTPRHLPRMKVKEIAATVSQTVDLTDADGRTVPAFTEVSDGVREETADRFGMMTFESLLFNLFIPECAEAGKSYPLVVFINDAGSNGPDGRLTLMQGFGATGFALPEIQEKTPCYVLAPQIPSEGGPMTTDEFTCTETLDVLRRLVHYVTEQYPINPERVYVTGQSQGCMGACEMMVREPDLFAKALLVAGQWNPETVGKACAGKKIWIFVSDGDLKACPGMKAVCRALEENGAKVAYHELNAKAPLDEQNAAVLEQERDGANVRMTVFTNHSVIPEGVNDNPGSNHMNTWPATYRLRAVREWLLEG